MRFKIREKWSDRTVKFWCADVETSIAISLLGFVVAFVPSGVEMPEVFEGLLLYIGMLLILWSARSAALAFSKKPNTLSLKNVFILATLFTLFGVLLMFV